MHLKNLLRGPVASVLVSFSLAGCSTVESLFERERETPVDDLPLAVVSAAQEEAPGLIVKEAEVTVEKDRDHEPYVTRVSLKNR